MRRLNFELGQTLFLYIFFSMFVGGPCSIFSPILAIHSTGLKQIFALVFAFLPFIIAMLFFVDSMAVQRCHATVPAVVGVIALPLLIWSIVLLHRSLLNSHLIVAGKMENVSGFAFMGVSVGVWLAGISGGVLVLCMLYFFRRGIQLEKRVTRAE